MCTMCMDTGTYMFLSTRSETAPYPLYTPTPAPLPPPNGKPADIATNTTPAGEICTAVTEGLWKMQIRRFVGSAAELGPLRGAVPRSMRVTGRKQQ